MPDVEYGQASGDHHHVHGIDGILLFFFKIMIIRLVWISNFESVKKIKDRPKSLPHCCSLLFLYRRSSRGWRHASARRPSAADHWVRTGRWRRSGSWSSPPMAAMRRTCRTYRTGVTFCLWPSRVVWRKQKRRKAISWGWLELSWWFKRNFKGKSKGGLVWKEFSNLEMTWSLFWVEV